ncbi:site-specific tyrosine recombinase/integron integrase [Ureibacillus composti]
MNSVIQENFFNDHQAQFSKETARCYRIALNQFFAFCKKNYNLIKASDIRAWLASLEEEGLKPKSINLKLTAVKSFYRYCMEENKLKKNPAAMVKSPKLDDSLPYYLSSREVTLLRELTRPNIRDRALVEVLYTTGIRISELLNIKLEDIKWDTRQIWIRKGKGNKERFVLFTYDCAERLKAYLEERSVDSKYLFSKHGGQPISRDLVELNFRKYTEILGFKVTPHTLRHTFAAHVAEKGMEFCYIQELLGHTNINSTKIYTRLMSHARKKLYYQYQN